jgi:mannobiose 2-epimerase
VHRQQVAGVAQGTLGDRARAELLGNILPFWSTVAIDHERGGIHGMVSDDLVVDDQVPRTAVLCARVLWAFSAAARVLDDPAHLATADLAREYLLTRFLDTVHGGVVWSVDADGRLVDDRKQLYAQAFAVYALTEYGRASGSGESVQLARDLMALIERHGADRFSGGYVEARARDWGPIQDMRLSPKDLNAPKSMNTLLHVMEAYTALLQVTDDGWVRARLADLVATILRHVVDEGTGAFRLFFDMQWRPLSDVVSFGHDIEGAWLLVAAARAVGDPALVDRCERAAVTMAAAVHARGRDAEGAVLYEFRPASGTRPASWDRRSHWWAQAEGAVGFLEAYRISGRAGYLQAAEDCWRFIEAHHVDRVHGDWFKVLEADRTSSPTIPKVGPWECPYHHVRACLELIERTPALVEQERLAP